MKATHEGPLDETEVALLLSPLRVADRVLIAVSGGPDSVALMNLAAGLAANGSLPGLSVATVDHGLQGASAEVAGAVVDQARSLGLDAHPLRWDGPKPGAGLQAAAREARYELLAACAARIGASHLVTAHTLDDQAETILFRMARGSGPGGLVGMRACVARGGLAHHRPFLSVPKARLVATCRLRGWPFVEDPANGDLRFARARMRALLQQLKPEGLDADTLATLGTRLARDEMALSAWAASTASRATLVIATERKLFTADALMAEPAAIVLRVLQAALSDFGRPGPPRLGRLEGLLAELEQAYAEGARIRRTLHGSLVRLGAETLEITPERKRRRGLRTQP